MNKQSCPRQQKRRNQHQAIRIPRKFQDHDFETSPIVESGEVSKEESDRFFAHFQREEPIGIQHALNIKNLGGTANSEQRSQRGRARNSAHRQSHVIRCDQVANLLAAAAYASEIGLSLNRMITIHWQAAGVPLDDMSKATGHFLDLLTKTITRHGGRTAWLWVHEGGEEKGGHCHLLVHVPANLGPRITNLQLGWLRRITGRPYKKKVIYGRPIGGRLGLEATNPDLYAANLETALKYLLKGADPVAAQCHDLERIEPGGLIIGKRCGTSQNIGPKARKQRAILSTKAI